MPIHSKFAVGLTVLLTVTPSSDQVQNWPKMVWIRSSGRPMALPTAATPTAGSAAHHPICNSIHRGTPLKRIGDHQSLHLSRPKTSQQSVSQAMWGSDAGYCPSTVLPPKPMPKSEPGAALRAAPSPRPTARLPPSPRPRRPPNIKDFDGCGIRLIKPWNDQ